MKRILILLATVAIALGLAAPVALAAEPVQNTAQVLVAINRPVTIAEGDHLDTLIVIGGDARISGDVGTIVVARGTATLAGATTETLVVVNGSAALEAGTTVTGDVRTLDGTVSQAPGATIGGTVSSLDADLAALGVLLVPVFILLLLGMGIATIAPGAARGRLRGAPGPIGRVAHRAGARPGARRRHRRRGRPADPCHAPDRDRRRCPDRPGDALRPAAGARGAGLDRGRHLDRRLDPGPHARRAPSRTARTSPRSSASSSWPSPGCSPS